MTQGRHIYRGRTACAGGMLAMALLLGGCTGDAAGAFAVADAAIIINTDKTLVDHVASLTSGKDCSTVRAQQGYHWCREPYENQPVVPSLYCYRTLADVTCYDRPSTHPADKLVGVRPGGLLPTY